MNGYFKPLRRKFGIVMLVMACVFAAAWVRSVFAVDEIHIFIGSSYITLESRPHFIVGTYNLFEGLQFPLSIEWNVNSLKEVTLPDDTPIYGETHWQNVGMNSTGSSAIPYWSIVIPLTLFSAWLLFSNPRAVKLSTELPPKSEA